jgi:hypothetical protein
MAPVRGPVPYLLEIRVSGYRQRRIRRSTSALAGYRFSPEEITLAFRWHLCNHLSSAEFAELLAEWGVHIDPSIILDEVVAYGSAQGDRGRWVLIGRAGPARELSCPPTLAWSRWSGCSHGLSDLSCSRRR